MRIAIMQPYFFPYSGYFRLFSATDLVVIYDCVQFIRRGWIHRNRLVNIKGELQWLTLPLQKAPQNAAIKTLVFPENAQEEWLTRLNVFPQLAPSNSFLHCLLPKLSQLTSSPLNYLVTTLKTTCDILNLPFTIAYSSALNIPAAIHGEDRIITIAKHFGANEYINLAGGELLYHPDNFKYHGINLQFLSEYQGSYVSILDRISKEPATQIKADIVKQSKING